MACALVKGTRIVKLGRPWNALEVKLLGRLCDHSQFWDGGCRISPIDLQTCLRSVCFREFKAWRRHTAKLLQSFKVSGASLRRVLVWPIVNTGRRRSSSIDRKI